MERPLLVILNPAEEQGAIHEDALRTDAQLQPLLEQVSSWQSSTPRPIKAK